MGDVALKVLGKTAIELGKVGAKNALESDAMRGLAKSYINKMTSKMIDETLDDIAGNIHTMDGSGLLIGDNSLLLPKSKRRTDSDDLLELYRLNPQLLQGEGIDIHKWIGKLPRPKAGFTPGKYKYMGPYNPLDKQLEYDKDTGKVIKWHVKPHNKVDEIAANHDICYDMDKSKNDCDKDMVESIDKIPWKDKPWGATAVRNIMNAKRKLGLGIPKNGKGRRVKKTGKKN